MSAIVKNTENPPEIVDAGDNLPELLEREARIERAQRNAYYEIGLDLKEIRERGLYKTQREVKVAGKYSFTTFEEYVSERWDMSDKRAFQVMAAAELSEKMSTIVDILPTRESHVRELLKLEADDQRADVWQRVVATGETITAKLVAEEVEVYKNALAKNWYTIEEWEDHDDIDGLFIDTGRQFNKQDNDSIEWAQWSWNPITGCKHDCPYCYARDIANRFYQQKFEPSIYPERFFSPANMNVPSKAEDDTSFKNVFTGSMSDVFGRWVPESWIDMVIDRVVMSPQWNFLFLTKFPQRVHEFGELPENAWMGTTVDCQDRVDNAEKAFAKMGGGIKWLSVEPMLTPIQFSNLEMFDWVVIGGASRSSTTPGWVPPIDWVVDLHKQARDSNCAIYHKDNLQLGDELRLREFPWEESESRQLPEELKYLGIK